MFKTTGFFNGYVFLINYFRRKMTSELFKHVYFRILSNMIDFLRCCSKLDPNASRHLLRINFKKLNSQMIITKLICSLGYNKYVAKLSDLVPPALDCSLHLLGIDFISRRRRSLSAWISLHTLTISRFS